MRVALLFLGLAALVPGAATAGGADQTCPEAFRLAEAESTLFLCQQVVPLEGADLALWEARQKGCDNPGYWNFGPHVRAVDDGTETRVEWACYRL